MAICGIEKMMKCSIFEDEVYEKVYVYKLVKMLTF